MYTQSTTWLYLVLFLFIHFIQASTALSTQEEQSVACRLTPCLCCRNHTCSVPGQLKYTCNGCIDGFTGSDCLEPCPPTCVTCSQSFYDKGSERICDQCHGGFYNGYYRDNTDVGFFQRDCSLTCKPGCDKCSSYSYCAKCKTGYFLSYDNSCEECPMFCAECETAHGCSKCYDGYFWNGISCDFCKQFCKTCKSYDSCDECEEGFYLSGGNCLDCSEGCTSCLTSSSCIKCRKGFYLTYGKCEKCTENCDSCSGDDLGGYKCEKCRFGYYNSRNICKKCIDGCALCLSDEICVECINGYKLFHGLCFKCPFHCKICSADSYCSECNSGFFYESGKCITCPENCASCSSKETCTRCKSGYHGDTCTLPCYEHCSNDNCNKTTGECISCRDGYYFKALQRGRLNKECTRCAQHCKVCTNEADCFACDDGYKGFMCNEECKNCLNGTRCDRYVGYCFDGCMDRLSGENCDMNCDSKCLSCDRTNPGRCIACANGRYGIGCMQNCSETCKENSCSDDGICTKGCRPGHWGGACQHTCKGNCKENLCDRFNGSCSNGCSENYKGGLCICPKNCNCDSHGNCISCNKAFGSICNESCSRGCIDEVCGRNSGECSIGCKEGFNGSHCDKVSSHAEERPSDVLVRSIAVPIVAVIAFVVIGIVIYKRRKLMSVLACWTDKGLGRKANSEDTKTDDETSEYEPFLSKQNDTPYYTKGRETNVDDTTESFPPVASNDPYKTTGKTEGIGDTKVNSSAGNFKKQVDSTNTDVTSVSPQTPAKACDAKKTIGTSGREGGGDSKVNPSSGKDKKELDSTLTDENSVPQQTPVTGKSTTEKKHEDVRTNNGNTLMHEKAEAVRTDKGNTLKQESRYESQKIDCEPYGSRLDISVGIVQERVKSIEENERSCESTILRQTQEKDNDRHSRNNKQFDSSPSDADSVPRQALKRLDSTLTEASSVPQQAPSKPKKPDSTSRTEDKLNKDVADEFPHQKEKGKNTADASTDFKKEADFKGFAVVDKLKAKMENMTRVDFEQEFQAIKSNVVEKQKERNTDREMKPKVKQLQHVKYFGEARNECSLYLVSKDADVAELSPEILRTVWEQKIKTVVIMDDKMLSEPFRNLSKNGSSVDDCLTVKLEETKKDEYFDVLRYNFKKVGLEEERSVSICVFTTAPDIRLPGKTMCPICGSVVKLQTVVKNFTTNPLLLILRVTNQKDTDDPSLGGIFVIVDNLLKLGDQTKFSIPEHCVVHFLKKQPYLIQTSQQYECIYRAFLRCNESMEKQRLGLARS